MTKRHIYVIDDEDPIRRSTRLMLTVRGYEVATFESGTGFLEVARALRPGAVLLDIRMPVMDGIEVQRTLNASGFTFPVVVMTGHGDVNVAVQAMKAGAVDFIEKPFEKAVLMKAIQEGFARLEQADRSRVGRNEAQVRLQALTPREHEVLKGLVRGHPNKTIGYDLDISPRTVEIHRANLMSKLGVASLSDALRIAFAAGLGED